MSCPDWMSNAACVQVAGLPWTAAPGTYPDVLAAVMTDVCESCPARDACATFADGEDLTGGWWAGVDRDPDAIWLNVEWLPVIGRSGRLLGEQGALPLDAVQVAA